MAEASRIFVRGLPPSLSTEEFRQHFSKQAAITDAKFIPHRRIGYVGYKTAEDAAKAVKYHNKTFIRMSRILVEPARSIEVQNAFRTNANSVHATAAAKRANTSPPSAHDLKRKRGADQQLPEVEANMKEFLEVMQPPSKLRTWANEDLHKYPVLSVSLPIETHRASAKLEDFEQRQRPKKSKDPLTSVQVRESTLPSNLRAGDQTSVTETLALNDVENTGGEILPQASDADWLRSRTSRLLDLVDDDDEMVESQGLETQLEPAKTRVNRAHKVKRDMSDTASQTDGDYIEKPSEHPEAINIDSPKPSIATGRLFVRNLAYTTTESDLRSYLEDTGFASPAEVNIPLDGLGRSKGFAYIQCTDPEDVDHVAELLDGNPFQGRLLHVIAAAAKRSDAMDEFAISKLPLKKQNQIRRKADAASSVFNWNSMYMNTDAVMSSISDRLGISKSELIDPTSSGAAVKQAHAETHVIQETKAYFSANGVDLDAFRSRDKGDIAILVKNFPYGTKVDELKKLFEVYGKILRILMPPSGTIAIVEFDNATEAKSAFGGLAYRKFQDSILFLEKGPRQLFNTSTVPQERKDRLIPTHSSEMSPRELLEDETESSAGTSTLFVRNLNFVTTSDRLTETFRPLDGFLSARVKTKSDAKKPGQLLSMGFGFVEFQSKAEAQAALTALNGYKLDGHDLVVRTSHKAVDAAEERRKEDNAQKVAGRKTKIIIKNLPFEASKKDVRSLFASYGKLRSVRVPKKFDSSTRGFAFADFVTSREAESAMDALRDTHLLGRRLVLEFAAEDTVDPEQEIENMQRKVGKQADKVALQRLTGAGRKKLRLDNGEDADDHVYE